MPHCWGGCCGGCGGGCCIRPRVSACKRPLSIELPPVAERLVASTKPVLPAAARATASAWALAAASAAARAAASAGGGTGDRCVATGPHSGGFASHVALNTACCAACASALGFASASCLIRASGGAARPVPDIGIWPDVLFELLPKTWFKISLSDLDSGLEGINAPPEGGTSNDLELVLSRFTICDLSMLVMFAGAQSIDPVLRLLAPTRLLGRDRPSSTYAFKLVDLGTHATTAHLPGSMFGSGAPLICISPALAPLVRRFTEADFPTHLYPPVLLYVGSFGTWYAATQLSSSFTMPPPLLVAVVCPALAALIASSHFFAIELAASFCSFPMSSMPASFERSDDTACASCDELFGSCACDGEIPSITSAIPPSTAASTRAARTEVPACMLQSGRPRTNAYLNMP